VDPSTNSFCSAVQWLGDYETTASVHVLGPDYLDGSRPGDFAATGFPLAGSVTGLRLADRDRLEGADIPLGPVQAGTMKLENGGWIGTTQTLLWAWAFFAERWPGGGSPLIQSFSPPPWDSFAVPQMPDARVRLFLNTVDGDASALTTRTVGTQGGSVTLQLPDRIQVTEPPSLASLRPGTRFRWGPPGKQTVYMMYLNTSSATGSTAFFQVTGRAPDLPFPDFSLVGSQPLPQRASWQAFSLGPLSGIDALVTPEHLGMALLRTDGLGEDEWFISGTTSPSQ